LVRATPEAAIDEVKHAELCLTLAAGYLGRPVDPSQFPLEPQLDLRLDLVDIIDETVVEGCIGETLAAAQAAESLARATDPAVVAALQTTIEDEIRHAELAWRTVVWAIDIGGERVRSAVAAAFADFVPPTPSVKDLTDVDPVAYAAHGRLTPDEAVRAAMRALREVVEPCACALLSRRRSEPLAAPVSAFGTA
jgi:hypothetical protein